jgi:hypothetical protein
MKRRIYALKEAEKIVPTSFARSGRDPRPPARAAAELQKRLEFVRSLSRTEGAVLQNLEAQIATHLREIRSSEELDHLGCRLDERRPLRILILVRRRVGLRRQPGRHALLRDARRRRRLTFSTQSYKASTRRAACHDEDSARRRAPRRDVARARDREQSFERVSDGSGLGLDEETRFPSATASTPPIQRSIDGIPEAAASVQIPKPSNLRPPT